MQNESHQRAAEFQDLAACAHRSTSAHHGKQDHLSAQDHSRQALEHANKAYQRSKYAHQSHGNHWGSTEEHSGKMGAFAR